MISILFILLFLLIFFRLFTGVYEDVEFDENHIFIKAKPCWKYSFHSPTRKTDLELADLSGSEKKEEVLYREYVERAVWTCESGFSKN